VTAPRIGASLASAFRSQYRSHTIELSAAGLSDQGEVYAGQFPLEVRNTRWQNYGSTLNAGGNSLAGFVDYVPLPFNESDLSLACRNAYVGKAKDGVYMPIRLSGPSQPFTKSTPTAVGSWNAAPNTSGFPVPCTIALGTSVQWPHVLFACQNDTAGEVASQPLGPSQSDSWVNMAYQGGPSGSSNFTGDTGLDNCMVGVVIFRGLSGTGGGGGGPSFSASVVIKSLIGLEIVPRPTSIDRVFQKPATPYNPRALEAYFAIANELAPAFPASANALGGLLPILASAASTLWPAVRSGLTGLRTGIADALSPYTSASSAPRPRVVAAAPAPPPPRRSSSMKSIRSTLSAKGKSKKAKKVRMRPR